MLLETFYLFLEETANLYNNHHLIFNYNRYHQEAATMRSRQEEMVKFAASLWEVSQTFSDSVIQPAMQRALYAVVQQ